MTDIVGEVAHVELRRRTVQDAYAEGRLVATIIVFDNRNTVPRLLVREHLRIDQRDISIDFVQLAVWCLVRLERHDQSSIAYR